MEKTIIIESDRDSVCMADDMYRHTEFTEFSENISIEKMVDKLLNIHHSIVRNFAIRGGDFNNFKCIRDSRGNWLVDKTLSIKFFFKDIKPYVYFDREYFGKKC